VKHIPSFVANLLPYHEIRYVMKLDIFILYFTASSSSFASLVEGQRTLRYPTSAVPRLSIISQ
jgi:hypothetical protein